MSLVKSLLLFICLLFVYLFVVNATCRIDCSVASYRPSEPYCYLNDDGSSYDCSISVWSSRLNGLNDTDWDRVRLAINVTNTVTSVRIYSQLVNSNLQIIAFRLFPQITKLGIRNNHFIISYSTFSLLPNLESLVLHYVAFHYLPLFSFLNRHLTYLVLYKYRILSDAIPLLRSYHVSGLSILEYLSLCPEDRTAVTPGIFSDLPALTGLYIRNMRPMPNPISILSPLVRLKELGINNCELTNIEFLKETPWLYQLTGLYFDGNSITSFSDDLFTNYTELKSLGINSNRISVINRSNFTKLGNLKQLSLYNNKITTIPHDTFKDIPLLTYIGLGSNPITTLSSRVFEHLNRIRHIHLVSNKLHCNCSLQWMSVVSQKYGIYFWNPSCYTPSEYRWRYATDLSLYTNCTRDLSYDCFNSSVMCPIGSYCQDTIDSHLCVCEGEGVVFSKSLNRCVDFEKLIRASKGEFITDTNGYATFMPHTAKTCPINTCPTCPTTTTQSCPVNTCPTCPTTTTQSCPAEPVDTPKKFST